MDDKESTVSGSPENSGTESPQAPLGNSVSSHQVAVNVVGTEGSFGSTATATLPPTCTGGVGTTAVAAAQGSVDSLGKKKRGRPRKYDANGNLSLAYLQGLKTKPPSGTTPFTLSSPVSSPSEFSSSSKKGKVRPSGSSSWQLASLGELFAKTAGGDFTPHVVTVNTGEDVVETILSFVHKGPRGVCVLSANGAVSNVTIRQPGSSGGILTYEGRFEILSLSGSYTVPEYSTGARNRSGGLSVSLAGPDGRVIGGGLAGLLTAASPIQIVVGSFMPNGYKVQKRKYHREQTVASPPPTALDSPVTEATPISQAKPNMVEPFSNKPPTFPVQSHVETQHNPTTTTKENLNNGATPVRFTGWNNGSSESRPDLGPSPDINVSVRGE
ncbi:AT-hook motif nuclear-localized protein 1-like isoform X2 [Humulus lupulus]|uniref:AT-hook motif nuclear-localized protein 1-like isoform X2 n=1 Tax=Humulus lupulus TaxID=3486 RepID=UPI002B40240B|nr:AT-hook motif nuclear-localized protein 1-like isoform X2 [Humulus lupulus]